MRHDADAGGDKCAGEGAPPGTAGDVPQSAHIGASKAGRGGHAHGGGLRVVFASANVDDQGVSNPARFDIERFDPARHLRFGRGIHFCEGALLSRLEARIAFEELAARVPGLQLVNGHEPAYAPQRMRRGLSDLRLRC